MSTTVRTLRAVLTADTGDFTSGLGKAEAKLSSLQGAVSGAVSALQGLAAFAIAKGAFDFLKDAVREYGEAQQATIKFQSAIANLGGDVRKATERASAYAKELSRQTLYTDDAILAAEGLLTSIGRLSGDGLERATKASADLAAGLGIDLEQAAQMVAKAAQGSTVAFSRLGIEGKTLDEILTAVEQRWRGVATAMTQSAQGSIIQLTKEIDEFKEAIGGAAVAGGLLGGLRALTEQMREFNDAMEQGSLLGKAWAAMPARILYNMTAGMLGARGEQPTVPKGPPQSARDIFTGTDAFKNYPGGALSFDIPIPKFEAAKAAVEGVKTEIVSLGEETFNFVARSPEFFGVFEGAKETAVASMDDIQAKSVETLSYLEQWAQGTGDVFDRTFTQLVDGFAQLVGDSIVGLADFGEGLKVLLRGFFGEVIGMLIKLGIQRLVLSALNVTSAATEASANLASGYAQTYVNSFASAAAIPVVGWAMAPGVAAANLAAAIAGSVSAMALGKGQGAALAGFKEGGIIPGFDTGKDTVPIMARPGEAVLPKELTDMLLASGGGVEIHLHGDLPALVTEINRETKRGNLRLVANEVRTSGLVR